MPLDSASLTAALVDILSGATPAPTAGDAASAWSSAIATYAATGAANGVPAVVPPAAATALTAALSATFATVPGSSTGAANGIRTALELFWVAITFVGMVLPPAPGGGGGLAADLESIFDSVGGTHAAKAASIVGAIDDFTHAVIVTFPLGLTFPVL